MDIANKELAILFYFIVFFDTVAILKHSLKDKLFLSLFSFFIASSFDNYLTTRIALDAQLTIAFQTSK